MLRPFTGILLILIISISSPSVSVGQGVFDEILDLKIWKNNGGGLGEWEDTFTRAAKEFESNEIGFLLDEAVTKIRTHPRLVVYAHLGETIEKYSLEERQASAESNRLLFEEILNGIGPEIALKSTQAANRTFLNDWCEIYNVFDPSFLSCPTFKERMKLSSETTNKTSEIYKEYKIALREKLEDLFLETRELNKEKLKRFKKSLSAEQNKRVDQLIGKPVDWERLASSNEQIKRILMLYIKDVDPDKVGFRLPGDTSDVPNPLVKELKTLQDFEDHDIQYFDKLLLGLLSSKFFAGQLEFTDDQQSDFKKYLETVRENSVVSRKFAALRFQALLDGAAEYPAEIKKIALERQLKWLRQTELQFFTGMYIPTFGLTHPRMVKHLKISNSQKKELESIAAEMALEFSDKAKAVDDVVVQLGLEFAAKRIELLTAKEKDRFRDILGIGCDQLEYLMDSVVLAAPQWQYSPNRKTPRENTRPSRSFDFSTYRAEAENKGD